MYLGDINGHVVGGWVGLYGFPGRYGVGQSNFEGRMLLEPCLEK